MLTIAGHGRRDAAMDSNPYAYQRHLRSRAVAARERRAVVAHEQASSALAALVAGVQMITPDVGEITIVLDVGPCVVWRDLDLVEHLVGLEVAIVEPNEAEMIAATERMELALCGSLLAEVADAAAELDGVQAVPDLADPLVRTLTIRVVDLDLPLGESVVIGRIG